MPEIDVADLPIEELKTNLSIFAHDCLSNVYSIRIAIELVFRGEEMPSTGLGKVHGLIQEYFAVLDKTIRKHTETRGRIETLPRKAIRKWIAEYKRDIDKANKLLAKFEEYWERNKESIIAEFNNKYERIFGERYENGRGISFKEQIETTIRLQKQQFSSSKLGLPVSDLMSARETDLYAFFSKWSKQEFKDRDGVPVRIVLKGKPIPRIKIDLDLLQRTIYNIITDAINHTPGRPVYITLKRKKGRIFISVTNEGKKLTPEEMRKIGRERYSRRLDDPRRGYGKIMVRLGAETMGGQFHVGNSSIGPLLEVSFPEPAQDMARKRAQIIRFPRKMNLVRRPAVQRRRAVG